jgi:hypothetical protein
MNECGICDADDASEIFDVSEYICDACACDLTTDEIFCGRNMCHDCLRKLEP